MTVSSSGVSTCVAPTMEDVALRGCSVAWRVCSVAVKWRGCFVVWVYCGVVRCGEAWRGAAVLSRIVAWRGVVVF